MLGNGNILTTNAGGVHELDGITGALVRTVVSGVGARFISEYDLSIIPLELTSFTANIIYSSVVLTWSKASETNNLGFNVQRSIDNNKFVKIGFVSGSRTTTETSNYNYTDNSVNSGTYYYRFMQVDYAGWCS